MRIGTLLALVVVAACGGKSDKTTPDRPDPANAPPKAASDAGATVGGTPAALSAVECQRFLDHVLAIGRREHEAKVDPKVKPSDAQVEKIRAKMRAEDLELCRKLPRGVYDCAMKASTSKAFLACQQPAKPASPTAATPGPEPDPKPGDKPTGQVR